MITKAISFFFPMTMVVVMGIVLFTEYNNRSEAKETHTGRYSSHNRTDTFSEEEEEEALKEHGECPFCSVKYDKNIHSMIKVLPCRHVCCLMCSVNQGQSCNICKEPILDRKKLI